MLTETSLQARLERESRRGTLLDWLPPILAVGAFLAGMVVGVLIAAVAHWAGHS